MIKNKNTLILYTTATCNLNCVYCYIDKNPALVKIDNILDESFNGDYYFNFAKEMFPNKETLTSVEFWGGEPMLRFDRAYYTLDKLISWYPNLQFFFMSTNFTADNWNDEFFPFIKMLNEHYPDRQFSFNVQLSLDGTEKINDAQRGKGTTKKFTLQFRKFIKEANNVMQEIKNVKILLHFKPTLTSSIIGEMITDRNNIIEYYKFFESYMTYFIENCAVQSKVELQLQIPNTAAPSPHTVQDGKDMKIFCEMCKSIMDENKKHQIFKYYKNIMIYTPFNDSCLDYSNTSYCGNCGACGSGFSNIGLLPYNYVSCCHNGFVNLISDYKKLSIENEHSGELDIRLFMDSSNYMIRKKEDITLYENSVQFAYNGESKTKIANMASMINLLAKNGQVDEKYKDTEEALKGALFIRSVSAYCFRDNTSLTGSSALYPLGFIRLLLNGAREVIEHRWD